MTLRVGDPGNTIIDINFTAFPASTNTNSGTLSGSLSAYGLVFVRPSPAAVQTSATTVATRIPNNVIRIGKSGSLGWNALVIEETRQNCVPGSRDATEPGWSSGIMSVTSSAAGGFTGPDGEVGSTRFTRTGSNHFSNFVNNISLASGEQWVSTMWVKSGQPEIPPGTSLFGPTIAGLVFTGPPLGVLTASTSWSRFEMTGTYTGVGNFFQPQNGNGIDTRCFNVDMMQYERGLFPTEFIWTSSSANIDRRASERLYHPDITQLMHDGQLALEVTLRLKGNFPRQFTSAARLWTVDENNYCEFNPTGSLVTICASGVTSSYVATGGIANTGQVVSLYAALSTGSAEPPVFIAISSSSSGISTFDLGSTMSGFTALRLPANLTGSFAILGDKSGNKTLSAWVERITFYRRARNNPELEFPATRHENYSRSTRIRPFRDRGPRR